MEKMSVTEQNSGLETGPDHESARSKKIEQVCGPVCAMISEGLDKARRRTSEEATGNY